MKKNKTLLLLLSFTLSFLVLNCSGSSTVSKETKTPQWGNSDYEVIADSLVSSIINSDLVAKFKYKRKPKFFVGKIENNSGDSSAKDLLSKNIERALLNSGKVTFISSKEKREKYRYNRKSKNDFKTKKEFMKYLKMLRTDYYISGVFNVEKDSLNVSGKKNYILDVDIFDTQKKKVVLSKKEIIVK